MAYIQIVIWALIFHLDLFTHHVVLVDLRLSFCWFWWLRPLWYPFSRVFDPPSICELVFDPSFALCCYGTKIVNFWLLRLNTGLVVEVEIASSIEVIFTKQIEMGLMMKPDFFEGFDRMAKAQITFKIVDDGR